MLGSSSAAVEGPGAIVYSFGLYNMQQDKLDLQNFWKLYDIITISIFYKNWQLYYGLLLVWINLMYNIT